MGARMVAWVLWGLGWTACVTPSPAPAAALAPPWERADLEAPFPVAGEPFALAVQTTRPAGSRVAFFVSTEADPPPSCAPAAPGVCLDLRRPQLVGTSRVGADHRARLSGTLPGRLAVGQRLRWQAVVGAAPLLSQTQVTPVRAGGLDEDGDGLSNAVEARRGLRGDRLDTDFGGVDDRQEGVVDHTDPTDPRDDVPGERLCADGVDNDGDLRADCLDPDCVASCPEGACADGVDDNFDGWTDCADPTCAVDPACFEVACADGLDSDGDGLTDCADPDCHVGTTGYCRERSCGDGRDEDLDGLVDCADEDCDLVVPCLERCWNQRDDNGDGLIDCADRDCASACHERQCADGRDDDGDALVDCEDGDCAFDAACFEQACDDGVDQDHDGAVDCDDPDCWDGRCHDHVLSWLVSGHVEASLYGYWGALYGQTEATGVTGRVRVVGPRVGTLTCTFSVQRAALGSSSVREGVTMDPACEVDERALPALGPRLADGAWYGPWVTRETSVIRRGYVPGPNTVTYVHAVSGPAQEGAPRGACGGGLSPVPMYRDLDGDGFGVSGVDRLGLPGGRVMVCGPPGPGLVAQAGDCDDGDPGWSPATVALAPGRGCTDVRPTDLDGDGYPRGVDQDDRDGGKH